MGRVLVTGASGFVGSAVARWLVQQGWEVRATGRRKGPVQLPCEYIPFELTFESEAQGLLKGVDAVVHVAGLAHQYSNAAGVASAFMAQNATLTERFAQICSRFVGDFVQISSAAVYGSARALKVEQAVCRPVSPYAISKLDAENGAKRVAEGTSMRLTILRLATVYGEGDPGNCGRLMRAIDCGQFIWIGDGSTWKSLLHKDDAAVACGMALSRSGRSVEVYNVTAPPVKMREVVQAFEQALGKRVGRFRIPRHVALGMTAAGALFCLGLGPAARVYSGVKTWLRDDCVCPAKAERDLGFTAKVGLSEGSRRQVDWYRSEGRKPFPAGSEDD